MQRVGTTLNQNDPWVLSERRCNNNNGITSYKTKVAISLRHSVDGEANDTAIIPECQSYSQEYKVYHQEMPTACVKLRLG